MIDLHMHSTFSDGTLTPEELVAAGAAAGLSGMALTDHDTGAGLPRFLAAAAAAKIRGVPGVEISVDSPTGSMHVLGYFIDPDEPRLAAKLAWIREGREDRNREILENLAKLGVPITMEEVAAFAGEDIVARPHFARAMVARGYVRDTQAAFDKFLAKGQPAYAERDRLAPEDAFQAILGARGVPVLAHPQSLKVGPDKLRTVLGGYRDAGLRGIEVLYPRHSQDLRKAYARLAEEFGLVATGGTDFHGAVTPDLRLGTGYGDLAVPDETIDRLEAARPRT
jgi:3',5'-nucleoside bisphosphate phosphatase